MFVLVFFIPRSTNCSTTTELVDDGCKCFPAHSLFWLYLCNYPVEVHMLLTAGSMVLAIFFFISKTCLRDVIIFILTFLLLSIASVVVHRGLHCGDWNDSSDSIMACPYKQLLHQHNWEGSKWKDLQSKLLWKFAKLCLSYFKLFHHLRDKRLVTKKRVFY